MKKAWAQLGDVLAANQKIRQTQVSLSAGFKLYQKNLLTLPEDRLIAITRPVHTRVLGSATTIS